MPPEVETLEGTAISETSPGEPRGDAETTETEEPDYKALWEQEKATRERVEQNVRARDIQLLSQKKQQEIQARIDAKTDAILAKLESGELTKAEAKSAIQEGIRAEVTSPPQETARTALLSSEEEIKQGLLAIGLGKDDAGSVEISDSRANHLNDLWDEAVKAYREKRYEASEAWRDSAMRELKRLTTQVEGDKTRPKGGLGLNDRNGRGAAAGQSDQSWLDLYSDEERGGIPATPENTKRARELFERGLRPKALRRA